MAAPPYNPAGYNPTNPATWPQPIPPATLYQPGMVWTMTGPGTVDGQIVAAGDLLYVVHRPRRYGDATYGAGMFGSTPDQDWSSADVRFIAWYPAALPPDQPPAPYTGCKFGDTGWWLIIEVWYVDVPARRYGEGTYGSGTYGGAPGAARWVDATGGYTDITISRGNADGAAEVDVCEIDLTFYDPDWAGWCVTPPTSWHRPAVGSPVRVSFYDPGWMWHPRAVGRIEQITDPTIHRTSDLWRVVTVQAFGHTMDLTRTLFAWKRPAEQASTRFAALLTAAGWTYGSGALVYPPDVALHADPQPVDVTGRDELDRTARSAGWTFDTDRRGKPRLRAWPLPRVDPPTATVVDCADTPGLAATLIVFTADMSQLLNLVQATNALNPPTVVAARDDPSVATYGGRDNALGFPAAGLAFANPADGQALVNRVRDRYSRTLTHVEPFTADTYVDGDWLAVLADADTGEHLTVTRHQPEPFSLSSIVVGIVEQITPGRVEAVLTTTTTTPTT